MAKHTLSKKEEDCNTRFLERDGSTLSCPYHISYDEKGKPSNASCGDWCPQFDFQQVAENGQTHEKINKLYLLCGSGNVAYTIEGE